jgi:hypothetical protein
MQMLGLKGYVLKNGIHTENAVCVESIKWLN